MGDAGFEAAHERRQPHADGHKGKKLMAEPQRRRKAPPGPARGS
jgi:hypothetical protein